MQWFLLFFTFRGITTHPWHPKGPRIWKLAKTNFQPHPRLRKFLAKTGKCIFLVWFQSLILGASFDRSLPFFQHVLFMGSLIHISNFWSLSQNCSHKRMVKTGFKIYLFAKFGKLTLFSKKFFKKFFLETSPIYYVLTMHFKPLNIFQLTNSIYIHITRWLQQKLDFLLSECILTP